jgi:hypothetical protein
MSGQAEIGIDQRSSSCHPLEELDGPLFATPGALPRGKATPDSCWYRPVSEVAGRCLMELARIEQGSGRDIQAIEEEALFEDQHRQISDWRVHWRTTSPEEILQSHRV